METQRCDQPGDQWEAYKPTGWVYCSCGERWNTNEIKRAPECPHKELI